MNEQSVWVSVKEASEITGVCKPTIYFWCASNAFGGDYARRFGRIWRFRRAHLVEEGFSDIDMNKVQEYSNKHINKLVKNIDLDDKL